MPQSSVVDVDDPETWPTKVFIQAERWANILRGTTEYVSDLDLPAEKDEGFRNLLRNSLLVAYHATRLLPHEVDDIRSKGLLLASKELVTRRITRAFELGFIDDALRDLLLKAHVFTESSAENRKDQICFVLSRRALDEDPPAFTDLLSYWGGELIRKTQPGYGLRHCLEKLGLPTIVRAHIDLRPTKPDHLIQPYLHRVFVGRLLGLHHLAADVHYRFPVPAQRIDAIWQQGHPEYDQHVNLVRT